MRKSFKLIFSIALTLSFIGCEDGYERLAPLESASDIVIGDNADNIIELYKEIFDTEEVIEMCYMDFYNESLRYVTDKDSVLEEDVIYKLNSKEDCNGEENNGKEMNNTSIVGTVYNGSVFKIDFFLNADPDSYNVENFYFASDIGMMNISHQGYSSSGSINTGLEDGEAPNSEVEQIAYYIFDSFLLIEQ